MYLDIAIFSAVSEFGYIKVNGACQGKQSAIFVFDSILIGGELLKTRICSCWSKFFSLRVEPFW